MSLVNNHQTDAQEAPVIAYCSVCEGEIYEGELYYEWVDGCACAKNETDCLLVLVNAELRTAGE